MSVVSRLVEARDLVRTSYAREFDCERCNQGDHRDCIRPCYCAGRKHADQPGS